MNLKTVKEIEKIKLAGIKFEWIKEDGSPRELRLTDAEGNHMVIRTDGFGALRILVEVPESETP